MLRNFLVLCCAVAAMALPASMRHRATPRHFEPELERLTADMAKFQAWVGVGTHAVGLLRVLHHDKVAPGWVSRGNRVFGMVPNNPNFANAPNNVKARALGVFGRFMTQQRLQTFCDKSIESVGYGAYKDTEDEASIFGTGKRTGYEDQKQLRSFLRFNNAAWCVL